MFESRPARNTRFFLFRLDSSLPKSPSEALVTVVSIWLTSCPHKSLAAPASIMQNGPARS
jgi:hypothetical protein